MTLRERESEEPGLRFDMQGQRLRSTFVLFQQSPRKSEADLGRMNKILLTHSHGAKQIPSGSPLSSSQTPRGPLSTSLVYKSLMSALAQRSSSYHRLQMHLNEGGSSEEGSKA